MSAEAPESARARLRWAVNSGAWQPLGGADGDEWRYVLSLVPPEAAARVCKLLHFEDRKRALASQLLQRAACERALGVPFDAAVLSRTKGGKPFLASRADRPHAPNWNFNVSHEGDYVVLAAEPFCVCGVDVAAPGQLRRNGAPQAPLMRDYVQLFKRQFTQSEVTHVLTAGAEAAQQDAFRRIWSLKEALVKARGDGLAFELGRADFSFRPCGYASLQLDGTPQRHWAFHVQQLGPARPDGAHWVTVARCRPCEVVDAVGSFRATLLSTGDDAHWQTLLHAPSPPFELLSVGDLLPAHHQRGFVAAGGEW